MTAGELLKQIASIESIGLNADSSHESAKVEILVLFDECDFSDVIFAAAGEANEDVVLSQLLFVGEISLRRYSFDVVQVKLVAILVDVIGSKDLDATFGNFVVF